MQREIKKIKEQIFWDVEAAFQKSSDQTTATLYAEAGFTDPMEGIAACNNIKSNLVVDSNLIKI